MPKQLEHSQVTLATQQKEIIVLCDGVRSPANIGSIFRVSDAFGITKLLFYNCKLNINSSRLIKTARDTHNTVNFEEVDNPFEVIQNFKQDDFYIIALEITDTSIALQNFSLEKKSKLLLILGNEQNGISAEILSVVDTSIHIQMNGKNSSLNVAQAAGIALYSLTNN